MSKSNTNTNNSTVAQRERSSSSSSDTGTKNLEQFLANLEQSALESTFPLKIVFVLVYFYASNTPHQHYTMTWNDHLSSLQLFLTIN